MRKPTIHMNGTGPKMLFEGYTQALRAVATAITALEAIEFNARDYYPQGEHAFREACAEMIARKVKLQSVRDDLLAIVEHIERDGRDA